MCSARTIILTRDADANKATQQLLRADFPDINIILAPSRIIEKQFHGAPNWESFDAIILTSSNALAYFNVAIPALPIYCVGKKTAAFAHEKGLHVRLVADDVAELKAELAALTPRRFLHIKGAVSSADFESNARLAHHHFAQSVCYKLKDRIWSESEQNRINNCAAPVFFVFSQASAHSLVANLSVLSSQFCAEILPISQQVAIVFDKFPNLNVLNCADKPNLVSMMQVMTKFSTRTR